MRAPRKKTHACRASKGSMWDDSIKSTVHGEQLMPFMAHTTTQRHVEVSTRMHLCSVRASGMKRLTLYVQGTTQGYLMWHSHQQRSPCWPARLMMTHARCGAWVTLGPRRQPPFMGTRTLCCESAGHQQATCLHQVSMTQYYSQH